MDFANKFESLKQIIITILSYFEFIYFQVVQGEAPRLATSYNDMEFSDEFVDFVNTW